MCCFFQLRYLSTLHCQLDNSLNSSSSFFLGMISFVPVIFASCWRIFPFLMNAIVLMASIAESVQLNTQLDSRPFK